MKARNATVAGSSMFGARPATTFLRYRMTRKTIMDINADAVFRGFGWRL
jgi:hypothetical protein